MLPGPAPAAVFVSASVSVTGALCTFGVQGHSYFSCPDNSGLFVRPSQVDVDDDFDGDATDSGDDSGSIDVEHVLEDDAAGSSAGRGAGAGSGSGSGSSAGPAAVAAAQSRPTTAPGGRPQAAPARSRQAWQPAATTEPVKPPVVPHQGPSRSAPASPTKPLQPAGSQRADASFSASGGGESGGWWAGMGGLRCTRLTAVVHRLQWRPPSRRWKQRKRLRRKCWRRTVHTWTT